jgi:hypothetical protein
MEHLNTFHGDNHMPTREYVAKLMARRTAETNTNPFRGLNREAYPLDPAFTRMAINTLSRGTLRGEAAQKAAKEGTFWIYLRGLIQSLDTFEWHGMGHDFAYEAFSRVAWDLVKEHLENLEKPTA